MKKNKLFYVTALSAACLLSLASCQGAQGPKGDQGDPGINGTNGQNGKDGEDGKSCLNGKGVPASTLGNNGDSYIDTETFDFYVKESGAWNKKGSLKGESTTQKGEDGLSIRTGKGAPEDTLGNNGDSYIDLSTFDFYVKADGAWSKVGNIKGDKGSTGASGANGKDGATAWSNTILPSKGGYVSCNVGSALEGETVTFKAYPDANNKVLTFKVNGEVVKLDDNNEYSVDMVENGFVVQAEFVQSKTSNGDDVTIVGSDGSVYSDVWSALTNGGKDPNKTYKLAEDTKIVGGTYDEGNNRYYNSVIFGSKRTLDLNGNTLDLTEGGEKKITTTLVIAGELEIKGKGEIKGDDILFNLSNNYASNNTNYPTKLTIGSEITTSNSTGAAIGIYHGKNEESNNVTENVTVNFSGKDTSKKGIVYVEGDVTKDQKVTVNIEGASSTGNSLVAGYTTLNVKDSEFNVRGTAFNIEAGAITFSNNKFTTDLGNDPEEDNKVVRLKTPLFVESTGSLTPDWNSTIFMNDDNETSKYGEVKFEGNTFSTLYNGKAYTGTGANTWYDVTLARGSKNSATTGLTLEDTTKSKVINKGDLKYYITATYGEEKSKQSFNIYFGDKKTADDYKAYNAGLDAKYNPFVQEYGVDVTEYTNFTFGEVTEVTAEPAQ